MRCPHHKPPPARPSGVAGDAGPKGTVWDGLRQAEADEARA
jgi:hypothetical protein